MYTASVKLNPSMPLYPTMPSVIIKCTGSNGFGKYKERWRDGEKGGGGLGFKA
jgi:hypothetical protein